MSIIQVYNVIPFTNLRLQVVKIWPSKVFCLQRCQLGNLMGGVELDYCS